MVCHYDRQARQTSTFVIEILVLFVSFYPQTLSTSIWLTCDSGTRTVHACDASRQRDVNHIILPGSVFFSEFSFATKIWMSDVVDSLAIRVLILNVAAYWDYDKAWSTRYQYHLINQTLLYAYSVLVNRRVRIHKPHAQRFSTILNGWSNAADNR